MTCDEFHEYWEMRPQAAVRLPSNPTELSEHLSGCLDCTRFLAEETEVSEYLLIMRRATPDVPRSLDASVRARYRAFIRDQSRASQPQRATIWAPLRGAFGWAGAFGFAALVAYGGVLLLLPPQASRIDRHVTTQPRVAARTALPTKENVALAGPTPKRRRSTTASQQKSAPTRVSAQDDELPTRFQSLMYCDPFSCSGAMDVIRVQLPSSVLRTTPFSEGAGSRVSADVLVGPDGIARGIRVVE